MARFWKKKKSSADFFCGVVGRVPVGVGKTGYRLQGRQRRGITTTLKRGAQWSAAGIGATTGAANWFRKTTYVSSFIHTPLYGMERIPARRRDTNLMTAANKQGWKMLL
jgi:hypothetical protein